MSPALESGLLGHSAAVWGNRAFLFGGLRETTSDMADDVAREQTHGMPSLQVLAGVQQKQKQGAIRDHFCL